MIPIIIGSFLPTGNGEFYKSGTDIASIGIYRTQDAGASYSLVHPTSPGSIGSATVDLFSSVRIRKVIAINNGSGGVRLVVAAKNGLFTCFDGNASNPNWVELHNGEFYDVEVQPNNQNIIYACGDKNTPLIKHDFSIGGAPTVLSTLEVNFPFGTGDIRRASIEFCGDIADKFVVMLTENNDATDNYTKMYYYDLNLNQLVYKGLLDDTNGPGSGAYEEAGIGLERHMAWALSPHLVSGKVLIAVGNVKPIRLTSFNFDSVELISTDWTNIMNFLDVHDDMHYMKFNNGSTKLYVGSDGGLFEADVQQIGVNYTSYNWKNLNSGLGVGTAYSVSTGQVGENRSILGSFQDMGNISFEQDNSNIWTPKSQNYGDGWEDYVSALNSNKMMGQTNQSNAAYTLNGWASSFSGPDFIVSPGKKESTGSFSNEDDYYGCSYEGLKKSTFGSTFAVHSNFPSIPAGNNYSDPQAVYNVAVCQNPRFSDYIYVEWRGGLSGDNNTFPEEFPRVYRSTVGGGTNISDWEIVYEYDTRGWGKIAINYDNPDISYISEDGKLWRVDASTGNKVDWGDGLPDPSISRMTINDICYVNGSDEGVYVATRRGIFYRDNVNHPNGFIRICSLPNANPRDIEIDYCRDKLIVATYGRGIWEADLDLPQDKPFKVSSSYTISGDFFPGTDVIVESGTLTVEGTLYMPTNAKVIVKPGARLSINGGTITSACGGLWRGVQLYGQSSSQQTYSNQATLTMYNGGTIEHAEIGVENWHHGYWAETGGIIRATEGIFRNNKKDVEFMKFQNISSSGQYLNDLSYFTKCQFIWDDNLRLEVPLPHVTMYKVSGVRYVGCTFADDRTNPTSRYLTTQTNNNTGIYSIDAKYYVKAKCISTGIFITWSNCVGDLNSGNWTPTTFRNLDFGIYASNSHTENSILVDRSRFENNLYGILLVNSNDPVITQNQFEFTSGNNFEAVNAT